MAFWSFDSALTLGQNAEGGTALTVNGGASFTASGRTGGGLQLNGTDGFLSGSPANLPTGNSSYSQVAWFKPTALGGRGIVGWGNYGSIRQVNALRLFDFGNGFRHYWWAADLDATGLATDFLDGNWHHVATTYDGTTRRIYLDGVQVAADVPGANGAVASNFRIGSTNGGEFFEGTLDDVGIYNQALTASEVLAMATIAAPAVTTTAATGVASTGATLNGTANSNGAPTDAYFRYSTVADLSSGVTTTASQSIGSGTSAVPVSQALVGLQPLTTYFYEIVAENTLGNTAGTILSFTTPPLPPTVVTLAATSVVPTGALLNGTVTPNGGATNARFEYSTDPSLSGSILTPVQSAGSGTSAVPLSVALTDLVPRTTYYFRAIAANAGGSSNGAILSFTTNVVTWGGSGADATAGVFDAASIPTTGARTFADVNGQGYYVAVTTAGLNAGGSASYFGDPGWWFEGSGVSSGYGTVTFRFFDSLTNQPRAISGIDFRLLDAEVNERFRNFGYWDANNNFVSVAYGTGLLTFSHTPIYHATDNSYENNAAREGGDQLGKWIELNLANQQITGFTFQAHRQTSSAGSVIMSDLISPWAAWRTKYFGGLPYPATADDLANPDGDAAVNVLEYFFGTDPGVVEVPASLQTSVVGGRITLSFPRNLGATDATGTVQGADSATGPWTDLARSINGGPFVALVGGVPITETGTGVIRTMEVGDQYLVGDPLHPTRFLRLIVVH